MSKVDVPEVHLELRNPPASLTAVIFQAGRLHRFWRANAFVFAGLRTPSRWFNVFALSSGEMTTDELIWRNSLALSYGAECKLRIEFDEAVDALLDALEPGLYRHGRYYIRLGRDCVQGVAPRADALRAWTADIMIHEVMV